MNAKNVAPYKRNWAEIKKKAKKNKYFQQSYDYWSSMDAIEFLQVNKKPHNIDNINHDTE